MSESIGMSGSNLTVHEWVKRSCYEDIIDISMHAPRRLLLEKKLLLYSTKSIVYQWYYLALQFKMLQIWSATWSFIYTVEPRLSKSPLSEPLVIRTYRNPKG